MSKQGKKTILRDQQGIIFVTVLVLAVVLSLILVGVISILTSHSKSGQDVVDNIKSEQLAIGTFYRYQQGEIGGATVPSSGSETMDLKPYSFSTQNQGDQGGTTPQGTDQIEVTINY